MNSHRSANMLLNSESQVLARVRAFLQDNFLYMRPDFELGNDDRLLERGVIDSMGVLELLNFLEDEFGVRASDDEVSETNLGTLHAIARFVATKRASSEAA